MEEKTLIEENRAYWAQRAPGYSEVNRTELATGQRRLWKDCLQGEIRRAFPDKAPQSLRVLDVGTGPGFFAIILAEAGFNVTAVDMTQRMLEEARANAGALAEAIRFLEMNAEDLAFPAESFDVLVTRNLTWNLPHPDAAYREWARVLRPGGLLLNFDANWYGYLFDDKARDAFDADRQNSAASGLGDQNVGENFDVMEEIARQVPLSGVPRPDWDLKLLAELGLPASADEEIWRRVWSEGEKINFASTPMFLVRAVKMSAGHLP